jgi:hypothetical protein
MVVISCILILSLVLCFKKKFGKILIFFKINFFIFFNYFSTLILKIIFNIIIKLF